MRNLKVIVTVFIIILRCQYIHSQNIDETGIQLSIQNNYEDLAELFSKHKRDLSVSKSYAETFLLKAKQENNTLKKADGYYMLASISQANEALLYSDSIITITKDIKDFNYPAKAHILKAKFLGSKTKYQKAMDELVKANAFANSNNNVDQQYQIKYFIALLKNSLGDYEGSLELFKNVVAYYKNGFSKNLVTDYESSFTRNKTYESGYITSLYAYGNQLNILKHFNEAEKINTQAIGLSLKTKDSLHYGRLLFSTAITLYWQNKYQASLDSIKKAEKINKNKKINTATIVSRSVYLGKLYFKQNKPELAIKHLEKVDSLVFAKNHFFPSIRGNYELLIQYYKDKKNTKQQLFYINRLLKADSILDSDVKYLSKQMNEAYSTPNLILEKQQIIESLKRNNRIKMGALIAFSVFIILLIVILIRNNKKKKVYKKRFQELLDNTNFKTIPLKEKKESVLIKKESKQIDVSEIIVNDILEKLQKFESDKGFLEKNISVTSLSKKFKTNSKYFSKIVNAYKNKSFSNYINELRINYSIEELKLNSKFRKYTIKAIANEIGFNTTEAFSKSFYKTTGIYPSFFIKELEKTSLRKPIKKAS